MADQASCGTCRFWFKASEVEKVCRWKPFATLIPGAGMSGPQTISYFAPMEPTGWCGQYQPKGGVSEVVQFQPEPGDGTSRL